MKYKFLINLLSLLLSITAVLESRAQSGKGIVGTIGYYNVENLFDTEDDIKINDEEFLPGGDFKWDQKRYESKIVNISNVIDIMAGGPDILGLSEIENRKVLEDLIQKTKLARHKYQIVHFDSPDRRGVDVALLYKPSKFQPFNVERIALTDPEEPRFRTRDMLWVSGLFMQDTIHVVVNHWPSRWGGKTDKRKLAAELLRDKIDKVFEKNKDAKIVVMGDFNDDPNNKSIRKILKAGIKLNDDECLYNTSLPTFRKGYGTLIYNGVWNLFDQIIISQGLLDSRSENYHYKKDSFTVVADDWMLEKNAGGKPLRTFNAGAYKGGYSDHLPVLIYLEQ
ncbi:MAG: endonuclease/exonuclease/phosphatase family protein [Bacteroidia bacterium]|nr:endonuclease/exonuclease/phosphatase family protein [Bacteroidia bacterium]